MTTNELQAACPNCGSTDYDQRHTCIVCEVLCCSDCVKWACDPDDEPCGDWVCEDCLEKI